MTKHIKFKSKLAFLVLARVKGTTSQLSLKTWLGFCNVGGGTFVAFLALSLPRTTPWHMLSFPFQAKVKAASVFNTIKFCYGTQPN